LFGTNLNLPLAFKFKFFSEKRRVGHGGWC